MTDGFGDGDVKVGWNIHEQTQKQKEWMVSTVFKMLFEVNSPRNCNTATCMNNEYFLPACPKLQPCKIYNIIVDILVILILATLSAVIFISMSFNFSEDSASWLTAWVVIACQGQRCQSHVHVYSGLNQPLTSTTGTKLHQNLHPETTNLKGHTPSTLTISSCET